jgi:hypothetical protein
VDRTTLLTGGRSIDGLTAAGHELRARYDPDWIRPHGERLMFQVWETVYPLEAMRPLDDGGTGLDGVVEAARVAFDAAAAAEERLAALERLRRIFGIGMTPAVLTHN